jgi:hypothetical protein
MPEQVLLDNDVALKVASYALVPETIAITTIGELPPAMLGVGRFVIRGRLSRASNISDPARAKSAFEKLVEAVVLLEPDDRELGLAADLEAEANRRNVELDGGESQLLAILAARGCSLLITGDKRAIQAMAVVATTLAANQVACLEQLMSRLVNAVGVDIVRQHVCSESGTDRAITSCFACTASVTNDESVLEGLDSYIRHLAKSAPGILIPGWDAVQKNVAHHSGRKPSH